MLGGLGQCGVITKAVIELVPAKQRARTYALPYTDNAAFFRDMRELVDRPGVDHVYGELLPADATLTYKLYATVFFDEGAPPDDAAIADGLSVEPDIDDTGYLDYAFSIDEGIDMLRETFGWDALVKPWLDVWLPGSTVEDYLAELVRRWARATSGRTGPACSTCSDASWPRGPTRGCPSRTGRRGFSSWTSTPCPSPGPDPEFVAQMLDRNERMFARARDPYGAVLYPIGSVRFTARRLAHPLRRPMAVFREAKTRYRPRRRALARSRHLRRRLTRG